MLSFLVLHNTLRVSFTYIYYNIDPIGFIAELCENKDAPEMQCNGKCHLKKVLKIDDKKENKPIQIIDFKDVLLHQNSISKFEFNKIAFQKKSIFKYQNCYQYLTINDSFHPPQV